MLSTTNPPRNAFYFIRRSNPASKPTFGVTQDRQNKLRPFCIDHFPLSLYHFFYDAKYNEYEGSHQEVV
jgi:hypothetical protein